MIHGVQPGGQIVPSGDSDVIADLRLICKAAKQDFCTLVL
jgi:hypothetical protein